MNSYATLYRKSQLDTASPGDILLMLFNAAVQYLNIVKKAIEENDVRTIHTNIQKTNNIILELQNTIRAEIRPGLAESLQFSYNCIRRHLINANVYKKMEDVDIALKSITVIRDSFAQVIENDKKEKRLANVTDTNVQETHNWQVGDDD